MLTSCGWPAGRVYWLWSEWIAAAPASFTKSGIGKLGKPCPRLTAEYFSASSENLPGGAGEGARRDGDAAGARARFPQSRARPKGEDGERRRLSTARRRRTSAKTDFSVCAMRSDARGEKLSPLPRGAASVGSDSRSNREIGAAVVDRPRRAGAGRRRQREPPRAHKRRSMCSNHRHNVI